MHNTIQLHLGRIFRTCLCCIVKLVLLGEQTCWLNLLIRFIVQCSRAPRKQQLRHQDQLDKSVGWWSISLSRPSNPWQSLRNGRKILVVFVCFPLVFLRRLFWACSSFNGSQVFLPEVWCSGLPFSSLKQSPSQSALIRSTTRSTALSQV